MARRNANGAARRNGKPKPATGRDAPRSLEDAVVALAAKGLLAGAGRAAVRAQREAGLAVTYKRGTQIVREYPDGRRVVLGSVERPRYELPKGVGRIRDGGA